MKIIPQAILQLGRNYYLFLRSKEPQRPILRVLLLWIDVIAINLLFYLFLKSLVFTPLGLSSYAIAGFWGLLLTLAMFTLTVLQPWGKKEVVKKFAWQWLAFFSFAAFVMFLAEISVVVKGIDYSWLRVEMVKAPLWWQLHLPLFPGFVLSFIAFITFLMWLAVTRPASLALKIIPTLGTVALMIIIVRVFYVFGGFEQPFPWFKAIIFYSIIFGAPAILFVVLLWIKFFSTGFRVNLLVLHMLMIGFNYMGMLPIGDWRDLLPGERVPTDYYDHNSGVEVIYPKKVGEIDSSFSFLRDMVLTPDKVFINYGPTCGFLAIDRKNGSARCLPINGLVRDFKFGPGDNLFWATNWENSAFMVIDPETLSLKCSVDLFRFELATPFNFIVEGDSFFISNVTYPILAELKAAAGEGYCSISLEKSINFQSEGYTKFTDGVYGIHLDRANDRIYALVGMLKGEYSIGLVEIELSTFKILRDVKLPSGMTIIPVEGRDTVLLPAYYSDKVYEVSLSKMELLRTIDAESNLLEMAHDKKRGLFYGISRASGQLVVINDADGKVVRKLYVGAKPAPFWFDKQADKLFIGSSRGILKINLVQFIDRWQEPEGWLDRFLLHPDDLIKSLGF
jgi:hypothetical protein